MTRALPPLPVLIAASLLVSALLAHALARLVLRHGGGKLMDHPGPRSSHTRPTPRGGGIGIAIAGMIAIAALAWSGVWPVSWRFSLLSFGLVALVGTLDDVRPLPAGWRLLAHLGAALLLVMASMPVLLEPAAAVPAIAALTLALAWSVNLHNFMDGIDGLLAAQAIWCGSAFAALFWLAGEPGPTLFALMLGAACAGFITLNLPRARVFLGDGASGFIGLALGWLCVYGGLRGAVPWPMSIAIGSAFLVDGTATLLARMLRGERFWQAHRDHLYQRLVRRGYSHPRVTTAYMLWNLLVVLPILLWMRLVDSSRMQWWISLALCAAGVVLWLLLRRPRAAAGAVSQGTG